MRENRPVQPMVLDDGRGTRFELEIIGYQYAEPEDPWLVIHTRFLTPGSASESTGPYLMTFDAKNLADWIENISRDIFQMEEMSFQESHLRFAHLGTRDEGVVIRLWRQNNLESALSADMLLPRTQVSEAAAALHEQLRRLPPRGSDAQSPPFVPPSFTNRFQIEWAALVPCRSRATALRKVRGYMKLMDLEPTIRRCGPVQGAEGYWYVLFCTVLDVPPDKPVEALFRLLWRFPGSYGSPKVGAPYLWPDGTFHCHGSISYADDELIPTRIDDCPFEGVRFSFCLSNIESPDAFSGAKHVGRYLSLRRTSRTGPANN